MEIISMRDWQEKTLMEKATQQVVKKESISDIDMGAIERVLISGDLSKLTEQQRLDYVKCLCEHLGLDFLTQPFTYMTLQGKLQAYPNRTCADQLRRVHKISLDEPHTKIENGICTVTIRAHMPSGRSDADAAMVSLKGLSDQNLCNAMMKCVTKAKRRVTLSFVGLGSMNEEDVQELGGQAFEPKKEKEVNSEIEKPRIPASLEPSQMIAPKALEPKNQLQRDVLNKRMLSVYKPFMEKFPDTVMKEKMKVKYGVEESRLMTVEQLQDLVECMEKDLASIESDWSLPPDSWKNRTPNAIPTADLPWNRELAEQPLLMK